MSLSTTLNIAQSALAANAALSTIVSRNIAGVNDADYSTKTGQVETTIDGRVRLAAVRGAADDALFDHLLGAQSDAASAKALSDGLGQIEGTLGLSTTTAADGTATDASPATLLGAFADALQSYAASPADQTLGRAAVGAAKTLAASLTASASAVQAVRAQADKAIAASVGTVNALLAKFGTANAAVIKATASGADATDATDARNAVLKSLSNEIGISTADAGGGGLALYTDGGATLFQGTARTVAFTPTATYTSAVTGGAVTVDGVPVTGEGAPMASEGGTIAGLAKLRDTTAVAYGDQLDQIAGGLVAAFSETDRTGGGAPAIAGLFTDAGSSALPGSDAGLASRLTVAASADPSRGGDVTLLRDGGVNANGDARYTANTTGGAAYSAHLVATLAGLGAPRSFDPASGGAGQGSLADYAASSVSWLEGGRQAASTAAADRTAAATATATSLSSATGVDLDEQLSKMLDLEHSYQASAELMTTVKSMLDSLLAAVN